MGRSEIKGRVHSLQSLGTVDGPGVRYVVFLSGCPLRCKCCHNPDTWDIGGGREYTAEEIVKKAERFRDYFGERGGITLSGGEPLCQARLCKEIFLLCRERGINTCLDTSGAMLGADVEELLKYTDRVLLDIKYTEDELYKENVGMSLSRALEFLGVLENMKIPTTVRQVVIPGINSNEKNFSELERIITAHSCIDGVELLPFRKLCKVKYDGMGIPFPFADIPEADISEVMRLENELKKKCFE